MYFIQAMSKFKIGMDEIETYTLERMLNTLELLAWWSEINRVEKPPTADKPQNIQQKIQEYL